MTRSGILIPIGDPSKKSCVFRDSICKTQFKVISADLETLLSRKMAVGNPLGTPVHASHLGELLQGKIHLTWASISGSYGGPLLLLNHLPDAIVMSGCLMGLPPEEVRLRVLDEENDPTLDEVFQEITNVLCGSLAKGWRQITQKDVSVTKRKMELIDFAKRGAVDFGLADAQYVLLQGDVALDEFGCSCFLILIPMDFALKLNATATDSPEQDLRLFFESAVLATAETRDTKNIGKTVLVVDDSSNIRSALEFFLKNAGYQVLTAEDGPRALDIAKRHHIDVVLLDVMMPEMDGFSVLATFRRIPGKKDVPVLFCTAVGEKDTVVRAIRMQCHDYIVKPFTKRIVLDKVARALENGVVDSTGLIGYPAIR